MFNNSFFHMFLSSLFFFLMGTTVKLLDGIPISQVIFFRSFIAFIICIVILKYKKISFWGTNKKLLIQRGVFGTIALCVYFSTLQKLPLATAVTIQYLSPLFTSLLAMKYLNEPKSKVVFLSLGLALAGILMIKGFDTTVDPFYAALGVFGAMIASCAYVTIGKIKDTEHPMVVIFYFPLIAFPLVTPFMLNDWVDPSSYQWLLLILLGIFVQTAQYFMTLAYQKGNLGKVTIVNYLGVIYAIVIGYFVFGEKPEFLGIVGITFIVAGIIINSFFKTKKA